MTLLTSIVPKVNSAFFSKTIGPFIRKTISRGLHKTWTPCINGTKSMFTAYSTPGQLKPRLILAEGFWDGLIQAVTYLGRESVRINALKRCPWLAEAMNDCCACSVFNYIPDLHGRETRVAVAGKWLLFTFMADRDSCKIRNVWSAPEEKQILLICSELEIPGQLDVCVTLAKRKFSDFNFKSTLIKSTTWPRTEPWTIYTSSSRLTKAVLV